MYQDRNRLTHRLLPVATAMVLAFLPCCVRAAEQSDTKANGITTELNTELSRLISRLDLVADAGFDHKSGQYVVKVYQVSVGEECEVATNLCEGVDMLISVSSPDLYGDHGLYKLSGFKSWEFHGWDSFAGIDSLESFTSFRVSITMRNGRGFKGCGRSVVRSGGEIIIYVNPWKARCEVSEQRVNEP